MWVEQEGVQGYRYSDVFQRCEVAVPESLWHLTSQDPVLRSATHGWAGEAWGCLVHPGHQGEVMVSYKTLDTLRTGI